MGHTHTTPAATESVVSTGPLSRSGPLVDSRRSRITAAEVAQLPLVPHYVYACLSQHVYREPNRRQVPDGWRVLVSADEVGLEREGYYAAAYINDKIKHCIIAERGTQNVLGIRAGIWMYFDEPTIQFSLAEVFSKLVRLKLTLTKGDDVAGGGGYTVSYAGHSLGAVLAACRAVAERTFAITFESPGCKHFVEKTMHPFKAEDVDIICYLRAPNPINTLRPHAGFLVQLPYVAPPPPPATNNPPAKSKPRFTLPSPQDYLRNKILEKNIPELQTYINKLEPMLREMFDHAQMVHSISSIVSNFESEAEPVNQEVILQWPNHLMQFLEYFNVNKSMEDPANQQTHAYQAYEGMLQRLYLVAKRHPNTIGLRYLNKETQQLLLLWWTRKPEDLAELPLTTLERKALNSAIVLGETVECHELTAFQFKMLMSMTVSRPQVQYYLDNHRNLPNDSSSAASSADKDKSSQSSSSASESHLGSKL